MTLNNGKHLNIDKRIVINSCISKGTKLKEIGEILGVYPITVSKELKRNRQK